jgi:hypothetical protein
VGLVIVPATAGIGYALHRTSDEILERAGARRLKIEIKVLNNLVRDLPRHWDGIRNKADAAAGSIAHFQSSLGGKSGALAGAVEKITTERSAMEQALVNARLENWPQWVAGQPADSIKKHIQKIALGVLSVAALVGFAIALQAVFERSFRTAEPLALLAAAVITGLAFYLVGWLSFNRIELLGERVFPLRSGLRETAIAATGAAAASIAILTAGWRVGGSTGAAYALLLIAGGAALAVLGYFFDDAARGLAAAIRFAGATLVGLSALLVAAVAHAVGWPLLGIVGLTWLLLTLLAWPTDRLVAAWQARSAGQPVAQERPRGRKLRPAA